MSNGGNALTSRNGALWVQPDGPNTEPQFLGCHELGDLSEAEGGVELIRCFRPDGTGWDVVGDKLTPPDPVSATISALVFKERSWLEKVRCPFGIYVLQRDCGDASVFSNYIRGQILTNVRRTSRKFAGLVSREEDVESTMDIELTAWPPLLDVDELRVELVTSALFTTGLNEIVANYDERCVGDCGATMDKGEIAFLGSDTLVAAKADVFRSADFAVTWAAVTEPFGAVALEDVLSIVRFPISRTTYRTLAAARPPVAGQGQVGYSDVEGGAAWTLVSIGGPAAAHGAGNYGTLWALDSRHIWLASTLGYIYFSDDGGETWAVVEPGGICITTYSGIHFCDELYGIAGSLADVIVMSDDGGQTWAAVAPTGGAGDILCAFRLDKNRAWVGDDDGKLWFTNNGGTTWTQRTGWTGSGTGDVTAIKFANEYQGFMVWNAGGGAAGKVLHTTDGGFNWDALTTPDNDGLNGLCVVAPDRAYVAGEIEAGLATAVVLRVVAA
jgi:photosystem II stability/assembly factor-like uncharacterized protein